MLTSGLVSSASDRWYTPPDLLDEIRAFLGGEFYDPCPPRGAGEPIDSGLWQMWRGRIFVNPPYGRVIARWVAKAVGDPVDELVLLVPARTDASWFVPLFEHTVCFIRGRLRFSGAAGNAPFPSALVYRGPRRAEFARTFAHRGAIMARQLS